MDRFCICSCSCTCLGCKIYNSETTLLPEFIIGSLHILIVNQSAINLFIKSDVFLVKNNSSYLAANTVSLINPLQLLTIGLLKFLAGACVRDTGSHRVNRADFRLENSLVLSHTL